MHGPDVLFFTCKDQKQGGEIIQFSVMVTGIIVDYNNFMLILKKLCIHCRCDIDCTGR